MNLKIPNIFIQQLSDFNGEFTLNQIKYIKDTIHYIESNELDIRDKRKYKTMSHINKSKEWCKKYKIPTNPYY